MGNEKKKIPTEQDLSSSELVDQEPLEAVEDPAVRLAGCNQIPDFGGDTKGTLQETDEQKSDDE